jgi:hypothetical protein
MVAVFLVLRVSVTVQKAPTPPAEKDLGYQIGYQIGGGIGSALGATLTVGAIIVALGGVYHLTARKQRVTFREGIFNWPMVILAATISFVSLF